MDPREALRLGDVDAALADLQDRVRSAPADSKLRVFLFQLLCVNGQWDRAMTQLSVAGDMDAGTLGMVQVYRQALQTEALRSAVFAGQRTPLIFGDPQEWVALLLEALKVTATGEIAKGQELRAAALEAAPMSPGRLNGQPFEWIADADTRLGPMLEAIVNGKYYWIPFSRIAELRVEEPEDLRDLIWAPAQLKWVNGGEAVALLPTRYPGSEQHADANIRLGRRTEWEEHGENVYFGLGQRMLATDSDEYPLMEIRDINLVTSEPGDSAAGGDG